jgi:hypothetical protein
MEKGIEILAASDRHRLRAVLGGFRLSVRCAGAVRALYSSWQHNRWRRAMNSLASAQVTSGR